MFRNPLEKGKGEKNLENKLAEAGKRGILPAPRQKSRVLSQADQNKTGDVWTKKFQ
jgi:hypothetical protein